MKLIHLNLGWNCNNNCICCPEYRKETKEIIDPSEFLKKIKVIKKSKKIIITGGEPTINPYFFQILNYLKKNYPHIKITLLSNGRMFSYFKFIEKIKEYKINKFLISLYGPNLKTHDLITRSSGSFEQTIHGINNLIKDKRKVECNIILLKQNFEEFNKNYEEFFRKFEFGIPHLNFRVASIIGEAEKYPELISVKFTNIWPSFKKLLDFLIKEKISFSLDKMMPYCLIPKEYHKFIRIDIQHPLISTNRKTKKNILEQKKIFTELQKCKQCKYEKKCNKIYSSYLLLNGEKEFIK
jgi:MoaA/NifB/PqqE/SkfB family radical SAM enzyme